MSTIYSKSQQLYKKENVKGKCQIEIFFVLFFKSTIKKMLREFNNFNRILRAYPLREVMTEFENKIRKEKFQ